MNNIKIDRKGLNLEKIRKLPTANAMLDEKYGKEGTPQREAFNKEAYDYYELHKSFSEKVLEV